MKHFLSIDDLDVDSLTQLLDVAALELGDAQQVSHDSAPRSTPASLTSTTSSRRVGRFLPT